MFTSRKEAEVAWLKQMPLFSDLSASTLARMARHADRVAFREGKTLIRQGEPGRELLLILKGNARVERDGVAIAQRGAGDCIGELALTDGDVRSATLTAQTGIELLVMDTRSFKHLMDQEPDLKDKILLTVCKRLRESDRALAVYRAQQNPLAEGS